MNSAGSPPPPGSYRQRPLAPQVLPNVKEMIAGQFYDAEDRFAAIAG